MLVARSRVYAVSETLAVLCEQLLIALRVWVLLSGCVLPVPPQCCDLCCHPHKAANMRVTEIIVFILVIKIFYKQQQQKGNILPRGAEMRQLFNREAS